MAYQVTTATEKLLQLNRRIRGIAGGTSASKTISILLWLIDYAQVHKSETISVVSETFPHLKRGAIRDFLDIMSQQSYFKDERWNKTDCIYTFEAGSIIEFFSADQPGKVRGPRRDILFINEANNIGYDTYTQLEIRTKKVVWLDWNPVSEFWWYTEVVNKQDCDFITLTYLDNEALDPAIKAAIESRKGNKNWFKVYGLGELGEAEGRIYTGWEMIDTIPHEARLERYGLDFGYSNDPTAIDAIYKWNGAFIIDEQLHQTGLSNKQIADTLANIPRALVVADSAEPKSIDEIKSYGINIIASQKGQGSVLQGIAYMQAQRIFINKRSVNTLKEYRNYLWMTDKDGKVVNEPSPIWNHHMDCVTGNTLVDTTQGAIKIKDLVGKEGYLYSENGKIRRFYNVRRTGIKQIYEIEFMDTRIVLCSAEHPFLLENGDWCPASLLLSTDRIQLVTYGSRNSIKNKTEVQRNNLLSLLSLFPKFWREAFASRSLEISQRRSGCSTCSPQRWQQNKQSIRKFNTRVSRGTLKGSQNKTTAYVSSMAWFKRRISVSFKTLQRKLENEKRNSQHLLPLWKKIQYSISDAFKVLPPELQNESETAEIKRITRKSYKKSTYNLEVEDTNSFSINGGIVVHNCTRYAIVSCAGKTQWKPNDPGGVKPYISGLLA